MDTVTAALVILVMLVLVAFIHYYWPASWAPFQWGNGATVAWAPATTDVSRLRFRGAVFTVQAPGGAAVSKDVTATLNAMAAAHAGSSMMPARLELDRPLNPYSFTIAGVNDGGRDVTGATATLAGQWREL